MFLPFVKVGDILLLINPGEIEKKLTIQKAIKILGGQVKHIYKFCLPDTDIERSFVFIKKCIQHLKISKKSWYSIKRAYLKWRLLWHILE